MKWISKNENVKLNTSCDTPNLSDYINLHGAGVAISSPDGTHGATEIVVSQDGWAFLELDLSQLGEQVMQVNANGWYVLDDLYVFAPSGEYPIDNIISVTTKTNGAGREIVSNISLSNINNHKESIKAVSMYNKPIRAPFLYFNLTGSAKVGKVLAVFTGKVLTSQTPIATNYDKRNV